MVYNQERSTILIIMLSIELCKKILNRKERKYNNEHVKAIRDYLNQMALIMDELNSKDNE